ncbi:MAG: hypothetical protein WCK49_07930 [Myxococcaceae bacterium]
MFKQFFIVITLVSYFSHADRNSQIREAVFHGFELSAEDKTLLGSYYTQSNRSGLSEQMSILLARLAWRMPLLRSSLVLSRFQTIARALEQRRGNLLQNYAVLEAMAVFIGQGEEINDIFVAVEVYGLTLQRLLAQGNQNRWLEWVVEEENPLPFLPLEHEMPLLLAFRRPVFLRDALMLGRQAFEIFEQDQREIPDLTRVRRAVTAALFVQHEPDAEMLRFFLAFYDQIFAPEVRPELLGLAGYTAAEARVLQVMLELSREQNRGELFLTQALRRYHAFRGPALNLFALKKPLALR